MKIKYESGLEKRKNSYIPEVSNNKLIQLKNGEEVEVTKEEKEALEGYGAKWKATKNSKVKSKKVKDA